MICYHRFTNNYLSFETGDILCGNYKFQELGLILSFKKDQNNNYYAQINSDKSDKDLKNKERCIEDLQFDMSQDKWINGTFLNPINKKTYNCELIPETPTNIRIILRNKLYKNEQQIMSILKLEN
ncbi:MAG: hypothetical protein ACEPOW_03520 [Bacteroidales bacterium]